MSEKKSEKNLSKRHHRVTTKALKNAENVIDTLEEAANVAGKKIVEGASNTQRKMSEAMHEHRLHKYNPLFLEEYLSDDFDRPKLVVIADEDRRKGIDVCEGAIGWTERNSPIEILFIYEEFVPNSGLRFSPRPICYATYYRHPFESDLYLQVKDYVKICRENQLTELKNIAYQLGASNCSVEVHVEKNFFESFGGEINKEANVKDKKIDASVNESTTFSSDISHNSTIDVIMNETFKTSHTAKRPKLRWFANDDEILSLIKKRCSKDKNAIMDKYSFDITTSASTTISASLAYNIDCSLGYAKIESGISLHNELRKEEKKRFIYKIKF